ncbi:unnamed protein product [Cylindrotheca closterium]|uniref:Uncharacterized protein n=1 Tax=Cylindrotheca closterium TaxID=2856 RepID=A0AAD2FVZ8_9STRA|nr:unnamed protein product [Cylindrotheca closterium]
MSCHCSVTILFLSIIIVANVIAFSITGPVRSLPRGDRRFVLVLSSSPSGGNDDGEVPNMDWLTDTLSTTTQGDGGSSAPKEEGDIERLYIEDHDPDVIMGGADAPIPTSGVSISDEMMKTQREGFASVIVKIRGLEPGIQAAQIVTTTTMSKSIEPVRYLIGLSKQAVEKNSTTGEWNLVEDDNDGITKDFAMVDIPPYSPQLEQEMKTFMGVNGKLAAILITSKDCIHYDEAPGVYSVRKSDLHQWTKIFPDTPIVAYRMDIARDCREFVTQRLDGYGPFAFDETESGEDADDECQGMAPFIETGEPLTYDEWDFDVAQDIFAGKISPPEDSMNVTKAADDEDDLYSPEAIRSREEGKRILAVYTPGRTYGSVSYVFPEVQLVASGFTIPVEDTRLGEEGNGIGGVDSPGPSLDVTGYITTSKAGITRQMESARNLIESYADRFEVILPSQMDPLFVDRISVEERKKELLEVIDQYEKIGQVYEELGITSFGG